MKILQIIYSLSPGGVERFVVDLSNELSHQGHEVFLCVLRDDSIGNQGFYKKELSVKLKYFNLKLPVGFRLSNIIKLYRIIKQIKPDIVHCHQNLVNYVLPIIFLFPKIKFFHTIHNKAEKEVRNKIEFSLLCAFYSYKVNAITISRETSRSFINYYKLNKFIEIYNGRNTPMTSEMIQDVKFKIDKYKKKGNTIFLHVARFAPQKNQLLLINVFNRLLSEGFPVILFIIGSQYDTTKGKQLKSLAKKGIIFLGEKHNVADYYLNSDAFCLTSIFEGMPISLIEALACGCVPICTPVGGIIDTIKPGITGYLSQSISEEDYFQAILQYLENKDNIKREQLVNYYSSHFSIGTCAQKHIKCYQINKMQ